MVEHEDYIDLLKEQAKAKAEFCLRLDIDPRAYDTLTLIEIDAFVAEANKQAERNKRK